MLTLFSPRQIIGAIFLTHKPDPKSTSPSPASMAMVSPPHSFPIRGFVLDASSDFLLHFTFSLQSGRHDLLLRRSLLLLLGSCSLGLLL